MAIFVYVISFFFFFFKFLLRFEARNYGRQKVLESEEWKELISLLAQMNGDNHRQQNFEGNSKTHFPNEIKPSPIKPTHPKIVVQQNFEGKSGVRFSEEEIEEPSPIKPTHPKMLVVKEVVLRHFEEEQKLIKKQKPKEEDGEFVFEDEKMENENNELSESSLSRVMIFSEFRESVGEIVACLSPLKPLVRPVAFVGKV
jgi:ERCC4-related helicase